MASRYQTVWDRPLVLVLWALGVAIITFVLAFEQLPLPRGVAPLERMEFRQGGLGSEVQLPDNWRSFPERPVEPGIYRAEFEFPASNGRWAVYVPNYSGQIQIRVNDVELSPGGFLSGDLIPDQSVPFFAPIAPTSLSPGSNSLEIHMQPGGKLIGFLSDVYVAPENLLRSSFEWHYLRAVRLPELVVFWQVLLASLLFVMWVSRRDERAALYGALVLLFSTLHGIPIYLPSSVVLSHAVALLGYVVNFWLSVIGLMFTYSLINRPLPFRERYFFLLPTVATVAFLVLPDAIFQYVDMFAVVPFSLVMSGWVVYALVHSAIRERRWESRLILMSVLGACTLAIHDTLIIANVTPDSNFLHFRIVYILLLPALSVIFLHRLIQSLNHVDDLVSTLNQRVEHRESQLRETFAQRQELEGRQALNEERRRIMRDVHDGLGGQLMSIIAMSRLGKSDPEAIETSAQAALEELRMLIGSLDVDKDITGMLGTFRERAEQQLALHDIELDWQMIDIPAIEGLNPTGALNILRILQEATTNAAKHSGANRVSIRFSLPSGEKDVLEIDIEDNGRGLDNEPANGHGLKNMRSRAEDLGGSIRIASPAQGTRLTFTMPITIAAEEDAGGPGSRSGRTPDPNPAVANAADRALKRSIAVLPLKNESDDPKLDYFSDGISEDIIADLSRLSGLFVVARNSSFAHRNTGEDIYAIARELGAKFILDGSVSRSGGRLKINVQLTDTIARQQRWAGAFERNVGDIFEVRDEVTRAVLEALAIKLSPEETKSVERQDTDSVEAYDLFLEGRALWERQTRNDNDRALAMLSKAVELDPKFTRAFVYLGMAYGMMGINKWGDSPEQSFEKGLAFFEHALELDPEEPLAVLGMGMACLSRGQFDQAVEQAKRAIELNPNFAHAYQDLGNYYNHAGQPKDGLEALQNAMQLDPHYSNQLLHYLGQSYFFLGDYDQAAIAFQRRVSRNQSSAASNTMLASTLGYLGRFEEAREAWSRIFEHNPDYSLKERNEMFRYKNPDDAAQILNGLRKAGINAD